MNIKPLYEFFFGRTTLPQDGFHRLSQSFNSAQIAVRIVYLYAATSFYASLAALIGKLPSHPFPGLAYPLTFLPGTFHFAFLQLAPLLMALTFFVPRYRSVRILCFLSAFYLEAIKWAAISNSHARLTLLWILFVFCFLPSSREQEKAARGSKLQYLFVLWIAKAVFLLSYFQSGTWKLIHEFIGSADEGSLSIFHPDALPTMIASYAIRTSQEPLWGKFLAEHTWLAAPMFWVIILAQVTAWVPLFWTRTIRIYGIVFIGFHIGSLFALTIPFTSHIFLCGLLLIMSPFFPEQRNLLYK